MILILRQKCHRRTETVRAAELTKPGDGKAENNIGVTLISRQACWMPFRVPVMRVAQQGGWNIRAVQREVPVSGTHACRSVCKPGARPGHRDLRYPKRPARGFPEKSVPVVFVRWGFLVPKAGSFMAS